MSELTDQDYEFIREYIILRAALKMIDHDKKVMKYRSALKLSDVYIAFIEDMQNKIEQRLEAFRQLFIRVEKTNTPNVYEVRIGNRKGDMLLNHVEIQLEIERMFKHR